MLRVNFLRETEAESEKKFSVAECGRPEDLAFFISALRLHGFVNFMTLDRFDGPLQASRSSSVKRGSLPHGVGVGIKCDNTWKCLASCLAGAPYPSCFFASWLGRRCTTLQRERPHSRTLLGEGQSLPCQRWTSNFMKNAACDFSVQALKTPKPGCIGGSVA